MQLAPAAVASPPLQITQAGGDSGPLFGPDTTLSPFTLLDPTIAVSLGLLLVLVFPGLWVVHSLRIVDSRMAERTGASTSFSARTKVVLVVCLVGMSYYWAVNHDRVLLAMMLLSLGAVTLLPVAVAVGTIHHLVNGEL